MFDDNGDFVLKVKFQDTYKALANYINNGLGIKRDDVERYIEDFARKVIHEYDFYPVIKAVMNEKLTEVFRERYSYLPDKGLKSYLEKIIKDEISKQVSETIKEQVKVVLKNQE